MQNHLYKKAVIPVILIFLIGTSIVTAINGDRLKPCFQHINQYSPSSTSHNSWPMFHHDEQNTGYTIGIGAIAEPHERWNFSTMDAIYSSAALFDVDKDLNLEVVVGSSDDHVYCLNASDGSYKWAYETGGDIVSSPAIGDIYPGEAGDIQYEIAIGSTDNAIYCLDGTPTSSSGHVWWSYTTGGDVDSSPVIYDVDLDGENEVIVGSEDGNLYCLAGFDGAVKWVFPTDDHIYSSPAVGDIDGDGNVEIVFGSWDFHIYCVDGATGSQVWRSIALSDISESSPALGDVNGDGILEVITASNDRTVLCLNGTTGNRIWGFQTNGEIFSSPAIADVDNDGDIEIVIGSNDYHVYCLNGATVNPYGELEWSYQAEHIIQSSPALVDIDGDNEIEVVIGSADSRLYCLDGSPTIPPTGTLEWIFDTDGQVRSSAAFGDVDNDGLLEIIIGSFDETLYCLDGHILGDPPYTPTITGRRLGQVGSSYTYEFTAVDPNGKNVAYYIEWGDGITSFWTPFHASGSTYVEDHTYHVNGVYNLRVKARNIHAESNWTSVNIFMPAENQGWNHPIFNLLLRLLPNTFRLLQHILGY